MFPKRLTVSIKNSVVKKLSTDINSTFKPVNSLNIKKSTKESERMKKFREMLKIIPHNINRSKDPILIEINPKTGEFLPESEQEPTKWGDWQHGGRVSDF